MTDQWTTIRQSASEVLNRYERCASKFGRPPAFTTERGSYAILKDIARVGLSEKYYVLYDQDIPDSLFSRLNLQTKSISVCAQLDATKQAFVTAHAIGHVALKHPSAYLGGEHGDSANLSNEGTDEFSPARVATIIEDGPAHINEQPHAAGLMAQHGPVGAYRDRDRLELEANVFALELLAPIEKIRAKIAAEPGWTVETLATYFGLSHEAMRHQLVAALLTCSWPDPLEKQTPIQAVEVTFQDTLAASSDPTDTDRLPPFLSLDPQQRAAAEVAAPALVVAGPGAGKTRVLTARFVHLVQSGVAPNRILALTFSNKAANEMQERLSAALPQHAPDIQVFTFHSLGLQLLAAYGSYLGYDKTPRVLSDSDAFVLLRSCLDRLPLGQFHNLADPTQYLEPLLTRIGRLKDDLISPSDFRQRVTAWHHQLEQQQPADPVAEVHHQEHLATASKCLVLAAIYETYQVWLQVRGFAVYGDLIHQTIGLFQHAAVVEDIQQRYEHILVDEFQDINFACGQLVKALDGGRCVTWAVADPRQSIYGFRGAALSNLARFEQDYPGANFVTLDMNYRSVAPIVEAGQAIGFPEVAGGQAFAVPRLRSSRSSATLQDGKGGTSYDDAQEVDPTVAIYALEATTHQQEIAEIVARVNEALTDAPPEALAILCHNKYLARDISTALEQAGIRTNWSGQLEERDAFKDLMAVLLLATNQPQALMRLARMPAHHLCEDDLRRLLQAAARGGNNLRAALKAAHLYKVTGLTSEGQKTASELARIAFKLRALPTAWHVLTAYLFEETTWIRAHFSDLGSTSRRYVAAANQLLDLAREFALKGTLSPLEGTAAFVDYIASSRETGKLPTPDSTPIMADAVNVLTIHKSKGLEWPVVFVPDWTYPVQPPPESVPLPPHLLRDAGLDSATYSQACLYYVAVTRACDQLFLSRSQRFNRDPLPFWDDIVDKLAPRGTLQCEEIKREGWTRSAPELRVPRVAVEEPIPYPMIRQYQYCSQRAKYDYVYGLNAGSGGYLAFVRRLRQVLRWIAESARTGSVPSEPEIETHLQALWEQDTKDQQQMLSYYLAQIRQCALSFAHRLQPGCNIHLDEEWHYEQMGRPVIAFKLDEVEYGDHPIVRFHRYGKPSPRHEADPALLFYASLSIDEAAPEVRLHYLETGEEKVLEPFANQSASDKKMKDIYVATFAIKNGLFEPKPKQRNACNRCSYNLICPA